MKKIVLTLLVIAAAGNLTLLQASDNHNYPISPVPFTQVKITEGFWGQRLKASREVTIPLAFSKCEETGRYENFVK
ncbi:MAG: glycoside hydrolase family 127 protein, partial [Paludibacter sp.]|nr:glycoside hydrolase family 127 protein [Paludibacter sp.]